MKKLARWLGFQTGHRETAPDGGEAGAAVVVEPSAGVVQLQLTVWEQHR